MNSLTIIIPTYERHFYAKRTLSYWSGKSANIIALDGSELPLNITFLNSLSDNIEYIHLPGKSFYQRIKTVYKRIHTKFTMLHADDEFFLPSGLSKCIEEIEANDLVCCLGRCLSFNSEKSTVNASPWHPLHTSFEGYNLLEESPFVRILKHLNPYICTTFFSVFKTDILVNNFTFFIDNDVDALLFELAFAVCSVFQGKSKVINHLSWLRSLENPSHYIQDKKKGKRPKEAYDKILEKGFHPNSSINMLAQHLNSLNDDYSIKILEDVIYSAFRSYAYHAKLSYEIAHLFDKVKMPMSSHKKELLEMIGKWRGTDFEVEDLSLINSAKVWRKKGIESDENEILEIQKHIIKFN